MTKREVRFVVASAILFLVCVGMRQPAAGLLLVACAGIAHAYSRRLGLLPWAMLAAKLVLLVGVSFLVPVLFESDLMPGAPDQYLYIRAAGRVFMALRDHPFSVNYAATVGMGSNPMYGALLGWLSYLNGGGSVLLFRLLNVFLSFLVAGLGSSLSRTLYPARRKPALVLFLVLSVLPSMNAYSMFVLRDVLIANLVMLVALGLTSRKYLLVVLGLVLSYYTRYQLFFLLGAGIVLYAALCVAQRVARGKRFARGILTTGFVLGGYWVTPRFVPLYLGASERLGIEAFGRFLLYLVPSLLGLGFLFAGGDALEVSRSTLGAARLLLPDTLIVPALFLGAGFVFRRGGNRWRTFYLWTIALTVAYVGGYWVAYGGVFVRLLLPLYPLFLVASAALFVRQRPGVEDEALPYPTEEATNMMTRSLRFGRDARTGCGRPKTTRDA